MDAHRTEADDASRYTDTSFGHRYIPVDIDYSTRDMSSQAAEEKAAETKKPEETPPAPLLEALEEDDEFEEFEAEHWSHTDATSPPPKQQWMDNWDDDMDDDFTRNLRAALTKS
jgi:26 proteasome complex subunit DSS1